MEATAAMRELYLVAAAAVGCRAVVGVVGRGQQSAGGSPRGPVARGQTHEGAELRQASCEEV